NALLRFYFGCKTIILRNSKKYFQFEVHITEHCNLNCKGCGHFSSLADEEFLDPASFEKDCACISKLSNKLSLIRLLGGEPMLHPKLISFFEIARKYFKTTVIELLTNGTLLWKQPDEFWIACHKYNIYIEISDFPVNIHVAEIQAKRKKYKVCVGYTLSKETGMWKSPLDLDGGQDAEANFAVCGAAKMGCCVALRDGKIYICPAAAHIQFFNKYFGKDLRVTEKDYIDIYKAKNKQEILDFLHKPIPFCRYCNLAASSSGLEWDISKREISEWI
ncbi:MAG: radical SAM protein, partial [Syntrophomonadaceae bacterium]|nr:radical SAM protein [Syntrophomonadaceae bacterium]